MLGASCYANAVWIYGGKCDCISNLIPPKTGIGCDEEGIYLIDFNLANVQCLGLFFLDLIKRNELIKNTVVKHEQHIFRVYLILNTKKSFRSIVCFYVMHSSTRNQSFELRLIRAKSYGAMEKNLKIRPDI